MARAVKLSVSEVYKIKRAAEKGSQADRELGPHGRELFYFGRRFRDLADVPSALDVVKVVVEEYKNAMWQGWPISLDTALPRDSGEEEGVKVGWGFWRYDARKHSLYLAFHQHLSSYSKCWDALRCMEGKYNAYGEACRKTYQAILEDTKTRLAALPEDQAELMALPLLVDGLHRKRTGSGLIVPSEKRTGNGWELHLGAWSVGPLDDLAEVESVVALYKKLRALRPYETELGSLVEADVAVHKAVQEFKETLTSDALLRKLVLEGHCDWCPFTASSAPAPG